MAYHNSSVLVDCNRYRDTKRGETVVVATPAQKKSHKLQNTVVFGRDKCCNMFTAQSSSSTTFEQYRHGIAAHMLVEHATLTRYMQALLECNALRGHIVYHPTNVSLATTPEWTCRAVGDTRHSVDAQRADDSRRWGNILTVCYTTCLHVVYTCIYYKFNKRDHS